MIKKIINGIFKLVISLCNSLLNPIDTLIGKLIPGYDDASAYLGNFTAFIKTFEVWVISYLGISSVVLTTVKATVTFVLTITLTVHSIKQAISWYNALKV